MRIRHPCHRHTYPRQRWGSPLRCSNLELEFGECGAIPGRGLLLTAERQIEGRWGRRLWWEMPLEESQAAMEARWYCWVTCRGWRHHNSLSLPTCQHWQLNNREADPSNAWRTELQSRTPPRVLLSVTDAQIYRVGPQPLGAPLCAWHAEQQRRTPRQGSPLSARMGGAKEKSGQRGLLITSYKRLEKRLWQDHNSCSWGSPCPCTLGATRVPETQAAVPPSHSTLTGAELPQKKDLHLCTQSHFSCVQLFVIL